MRSLESYVRNALIQQRTEELASYASENTGCRNLIATLIKNAGNSIMEYTRAYYDDCDDLYERVQYKQEFMMQLQTEIGNPQQIIKWIHDQVTDQYMSHKKWKAEINALIKKVRADGGNEFYESNSFEGILQYAKDRDVFVRKLKEISVIKGLDRAVQKDSQYKAIRELFPSSRDYRTHIINGMEEFSKFFQRASRQLQNSWMAAGLEGRIKGSIVDTIGKIVIGIAKMRDNQQIEKIIREIYF